MNKPMAYVGIAIFTSLIVMFGVMSYTSTPMTQNCTFDQSLHEWICRDGADHGGTGYGLLAIIMILALCTLIFTQP